MIQKLSSNIASAYILLDQLSAIKLMSITELASTIHVKDAITFSINSEFLNYNFDIVKQCLLKIKDLQVSLGQNKQNLKSLQNRLTQNIAKTDENRTRIVCSEEKLKQFEKSVGDQFMKKMYGIEEKTKNMYDFQQTLRRLQQTDKFVLLKTFDSRTLELKQELSEVWKIKSQFDRYVSKNAFEEYKKEQRQEIYEKQCKINQTNSQIKRLQQKIENLNKSVDLFKEEIRQNNKLIGDMNFTQILDQIKLFKEQISHRVSQLAGKLKKKVSLSQIIALEKSMIQKLDKFLCENEKNKAQKKETKQAFLFLQKKIHIIEQILTEKFPEDQKDALFTAKKVQCASCSKDLGKYEGRLGQFRPWSIFPCKQPDPQKSGGFGYLNYIDKMSYRKGFDLEDQNLERLSKTLNESKESKETHSKRLNSTRNTNLIQNFGSQEKVTSLKDVYFRQIASQRGERPLGSSFRVKREVKSIIQEPKQAESK